MSRVAAPVVEIPVDVALRLRVDDDHPLRRTLAVVDLDAPGVPPVLRALRSRQRPLVRWIDSLLPEPDPLGGAADVALGRRTGSVERALAARPFVLWHQGRYWVNAALPLVVLDAWVVRVEARVRALAEAAEDLAAGEALLAEAAGLLPEGGGRLDRRQGEVGAARARTEGQRGELERLARELAHAREATAAEAARRRRPDPDQATVMTWSMDISALLAEAVAATTG